MDKMEAKRKMLKELKKQMMSEDDMGLGDALKSKMKVTVAADSPKELKKGLSKAEEILEKRKEMLGLEAGECPVEEMAEMMEDEEEEEMADGGKAKKKYADGGRMGMDYDEEEGEVPGEQDTGPDEYEEEGKIEEKMPEEMLDEAMMEEPVEGEMLPEEGMEEMSKEEIMEKIEMLQMMLEKMEK